MISPINFLIFASVGGWVSCLWEINKINKTNIFLMEKMLKIISDIKDDKCS